jgi:hypothetical protein
LVPNNLSLHIHIHSDNPDQPAIPSRLAFRDCRRGHAVGRGTRGRPASAHRGSRADHHLPAPAHQRDLNGIVAHNLNRRHDLTVDYKVVFGYQVQADR